METDRLIEIPPALAQIFMKKLAGYVAIPDERATYYLWEAINEIIYIKEVKELIKKELGEKYTQKIHTYNQTFGQINEIKVLLDHTSEHTIKKNDLESPTWKKATKILREEGQIIHATIHQILVIILTRTTLKNWTIKNEDMQIYQREYKKYTDYNTKQNTNPNNTNPQNIQTTIQ